MTYEQELMILTAYRGYGRLGGSVAHCRIFEWLGPRGDPVRGNAAALSVRMGLSPSLIHAVLRKHGHGVKDYPADRAPANSGERHNPEPEPYTEPATGPLHLITITGEHMSTQGDRINLPRIQGHIRAVRAPLYVRCYEAMQGAMVTAAKGMRDFDMEELGANIDPRLRSGVWRQAVGALVTKGLLELTTPPAQNKYRRYRVVDAVRMNAVMTALAGDKPDTSNDTVRELVVASKGAVPFRPGAEQEPREPWWRRWFGRGRASRRLRRIEKQMEQVNARLRGIDEKLATLIELWK